MFLLAFKGREQRDLSVPGQAAGKGTAAVRAADPPFLHPRQQHPSTQPPSPPGETAWTFPASPSRQFGPAPSHQLPQAREKVCVGGAAGWGGVQGEKVTLRVVVVAVATRLRGGAGLLVRVGGVL